MQNTKVLKVLPKHHAEIKSLAAKAGKSILDFVGELIAAYKGKKA